jgi:Flp pilus assembly protein TadG
VVKDRWRSDRGYSALEAVVILPLALIAVMTIMQAALYLLAVQAAQTAANKGSLAGAAYMSSPATGEERAKAWLSHQRMVSDVRASSAGSTSDSVRITVSLRTVTLVPGWTLTVRESAAHPVEEP